MLFINPKNRLWLHFRSSLLLFESIFDYPELFFWPGVLGYFHSHPFEEHEEKC
ncbi:uncharacterized protein J3R85_004232 [Psidium guajava]|nr:uncharacterized protein J3R85_004232 [Psidium guajava]